MTWVKVDDNLPWDGRVRNVSPAARWTFVASWCLAGKNLTDGRLLRGDLSLCDGTLKIAKELEAAGLWERTADGWSLPGYLALNRSREKAEEWKSRNTESGRRGLAKRYSKVLDGPEAESASKVLDGLQQQNARSSLSDPLIRPDCVLKPDPGIPRERERPASKVLGKPLAPARKTVPTEEWAMEMRERYQLRDFDETLRFHMNGSYYRTCVDKCGYLEGKLAAAAERESPAPVDSRSKFFGGPLYEAYVRAKEQG